MTSNRYRHISSPCIAVCFGLILGTAALAAGLRPTFKPFHADGIYAQAETVGWTVALPPGATAARYSYTIKTNQKDVLETRSIEVPAGGTATIEVKTDTPAMLYVTVKDASTSAPVATLGAAVAPTELQPTAPCPPDFDDFWGKKLADLRAVPTDPVLTPIKAAIPGVEQYIVTLNSLHSHVHAYLAKPNGEGKYPAIIVYQYAGVYALDAKDSANRASQGWLVLNVSSHDMPLDKAYGVPENYQAIGNTDREHSYFLEMYLRDTRAYDYLTSRPDWDGKTLVIMGASMGGQQSLATAGLNPDRVTAIIVNEPAGADTNGELHGRHAGYPNWPADNLRSMNTALYFDTVNFARHIKSPTLMSMGFIDTTVTPSGVWTVFNQIHAPKEAVPLIDSNHMHITPDKVIPMQRRTEEVLETLRLGKQFYPKESAKVD